MTRPQHGSNRRWSVPLTLRDVPESGRHFDLFADKQTRAAVAEHAGLAALPRLEASFDVMLHERLAVDLAVIARVDNQDDPGIDPRSPVRTHVIDVGQ